MLGPTPGCATAVVAAATAHFFDRYYFMRRAVWILLTREVRLLSARPRYVLTRYDRTAPIFHNTSVNLSKNTEYNLTASPPCRALSTCRLRHRTCHALRAMHDPLQPKACLVASALVSLVASGLAAPAGIHIGVAATPRPSAHPRPVGSPPRMPVAAACICACQRSPGAMRAATPTAWPSAGTPQTRCPGVAQTPAAGQLHVFSHVGRAA